MCTGLWDSFIGPLMTCFWGDHAHDRDQNGRRTKNARRMKGLVTPMEGRSDKGGFGEAPDSKESEILDLATKTKPGHTPQLSLGHALQMLNIKKPSVHATEYTAAVQAQQEILTEVHAADFLQHPHATYLLEYMVAKACAIPVSDVCVTGVTDKLFPKSTFLEDGGIIVHYAVIVTYKIVIDLTVLPTEDPLSKASALISTALDGGTAVRHDYFFTMQACIVQFPELNDAQIQLAKVINTAVLVGKDVLPSAPVPLRRGKSRVYYWNHNRTVDIAAQHDNPDVFLKNEQEVKEVVAKYEAEQRRLKRRQNRAERREKRRKEQERERENKENSDDDGGDDYESGSDSSSNEKASVRNSPTSVGDRNTPVALAGLGLEILRLQSLINPKILTDENIRF